MNEAVRLIDEIQAEHGLIHEEFETLARAAAQLDSDEVKKHGSGSNEGPLELLRRLQAQLDIIDETLKAHFAREKVALENVVRLEGNSEEFQALNPLWLEHDDILEDLSTLRKSARDIPSDDVQVNVRKAAEQDMKEAIQSFSIKLAGHAKREGAVFSKLRSHLEVK